MERMGDLSRVVPFAHCSVIGSRTAVRLRWRDFDRSPEVPESDSGNVKRGRIDRRKRTHGPQPMKVSLAHFLLPTTHRHTPHTVSLRNHLHHHLQ